jgi:hypothetical protein
VYSPWKKRDFKEPTIDHIEEPPRRIYAVGEHLTLSVGTSDPKEYTGVSLLKAV